MASKRTMNRHPSASSRLLAILLGLWSVTVCPLAFAHKPSDSYLSLEVTGKQITGQWDIALRDLDFALGLDTNQDQRITWGEVRAQHAAIASYALSHLRLQAGHECTSLADAHLIDAHTDGAYEVLRFTAICPHTIDQLKVDYRLFFDLDAQHKGLLRLETPRGTRTAIFGSDHPQQVFDLAKADWMTDARQYMSLGIWHIWTGFDHLLFLFSLLLPSVLTRHGKTWLASPDLRTSLWDIAKVVTAFTLAHSLTLSLAALGVVSLPSRWVESAIAASVVLAACNNLYPVARKGRWLLAFAFGLIHGFGFAGVLGDLGLAPRALLAALVAFNLGVECGQLALVGIFILVVWRLRAGLFYRRVVMGGGSLAIALIALVWFSERAFLVKLL